MAMFASRVRSSTVIIVVMASFFAVAKLFAAAPATQPASSNSQIKAIAKPAATQPAKAKWSIPSDWVQLANTQYQFSFYGPKNWDQKVSNDGQVTYWLPAAKNREPAQFQVQSAECHETTLDDEVSTWKKSFPQNTPKGKITRDQAFSLGGRPAWLIEYDVMVTKTVPPMTPTQKPHQVTKKIFYKYLIYTKGKTILYITFAGDSRTYADGIANAERVLDTFAWTDTGSDAGKQ